MEAFITSQKIPFCMESEFRDRFLAPVNLQGIVDMAFEEKKELKFLLTGVGKDEFYDTHGEKMQSILADYANLEKMVYSIIPNVPVISKKKGMAEILKDIKPYFYELAGITPVKDPNIYISGSRFKVIMGLLQPFYACYAVAGAVLALPAFALGLGIPAAMGIGLAGCAVVSAANYAMLAKKIKGNSSFTFSVGLFDRIYILPSNKTAAAKAISHEYIHNVCMKTNLFKEGTFFDEGIATSMSQSMLIMAGQKHPAYEAYARLERIFTAILSFGEILRRSGKILGELNSKPLNKETVVYTCGATMFNLAEYKYGKGIYKDLFNGKYDCLLD